jgi:hypothetical protein
MAHSTIQKERAVCGKIELRGFAPARILEYPDWIIGRLELWNIGYQERKSLLTPFLLLNPSFQYSTIPTFHVDSTIRP